MNLTSVVLTALGLFAGKGHEVSGLIEDAQGKPSPGVALWLSAGSNQDGSTPSLTRGTTDRVGRFTMLVPAGMPRGGRSLEMLSVWAYHPGALPGRIHV